MNASNYSANGQFVLTSLILFTKQSKNSSDEVAWDLTTAYTECSLFESIDGEAMSGYVVVLDSINLNDVLPLYGNERIEVSFHTAGADQYPIEYTGFVYKVSERIRLSEHSMTYKISFTSEEFLKSERTFVQTGYVETNDRIAYDIYRTFMRSERNKPFISDKTLGVSEFTFGAVKPIEAINILTRDSVATNGNLGYLFFENNESFNFVSIQSLYQQEPSARYTNRLAGYYDDVKQRAIEQFESIQDIKYYEENSFLDRINDGLHGSDHVYFDIVTKQTVVHHYNKSDKFDKTKSLGEIANKKEIDDAHDVMYLGYVSDTLNRTPFEVDSKMKLVESTMFKALITVFGDSRLKAGDVLEVYFPRLQVDQETLRNIYEGKVLISAIRHTFTPDQYMQEIEVIKDAYNEL